MDSIFRGNVLDRHLILLDCDSSRLPLSDCRRRPTSYPATSRTSSIHPGARPFADQRALELGHGSEQVE